MNLKYSKYCKSFYNKSYLQYLNFNFPILTFLQNRKYVFPEAASMPADGQLKNRDRAEHSRSNFHWLNQYQMQKLVRRKAERK